MSATITQFEATTAAAATVRIMRAGVYRGAGRVTLEQVPVPEIAAGELLVRVAACGICGTDVKKIQHGFVAPPQIFGHEIAGAVVAAGAGARFRAGDRVITFHHIPCGACFYCKRSLFSQCTTYKKTGVTAGFDPNGGGFAEYVRIMPWVAERGVIAIPSGVSFEEATFVEPVNTCIKAVEKARVAAGETVVVLGQGPIGLMLLMLAHRAGARVLTSDPVPARRARSVAYGAVACVDPAQGSLLDEVRGHTSGRGADVVLVAVPSPALVSEALAIARPGGRVLLFAHNDPQMRIEFPAAAIGVEEKEILGSYSAAIDRQQESARIVFQRQLPLAELVTHRFPLEQIQQALDLAARPAGDSLKVVVTP